MPKKSPLAISFSRNLLKRWVLWPFAVVDIAGLIAGLAVPNFSLPAYVYALESVRK
jgi:hypothetical protein